MLQFRCWFIDWANHQIQQILEIQSNHVLKEHSPQEKSVLCDSVNVDEETINEVSDVTSTNSDFSLTTSDDNLRVMEITSHSGELSLPDEKISESEGKVTNSFMSSIWEFFTPPLRPPHAEPNTSHSQ